MANNEHKAMIDLALEAACRAYVPYSKFPVGASLRTKSGRIYTGCNVENAAFPVTICAERVAMFKAVSDGEKDFELMVVATPTGGTPCGACRQVMAEFSLDMTVLICDGEGHLIQQTTVAVLLPGAFTPKDLKSKA